MIDVWWYAPGAPVAHLLHADGLGQRRPGFVWIDVVDPDRTSVDLLVARLGLDPLVALDLGDRHPRSRIVPWGATAHAAVPTCALVGGAVTTTVVDLVFGAGMVLTLRWSSEDGGGAYPIDPVRRNFEASIRHDGPSGLGGWLWAFFDRLVEDAFDVVDRIDDQLDAGEEVVFDEEVDRTVPKELFGARRDLAALRRALTPQRDVAGGLLRDQRDLLDPASRTALAQAHDHLLRLLELVEGQRDLLGGLFDAHLAISANRSNEVMKRTSSWGAILVVATIIVGYYGMNFPDIPELGWRRGWLLPLGMILVVTTGLYTLFKRRDWL